MPTLKEKSLKRLLKRRTALQARLDELSAGPTAYSIQGSVSVTNPKIEEIQKQPEGWSKADCDAMFRDILIEDGIRRTRAWTAWAGLKVGGWATWNKYKRQKQGAAQEMKQ